MGLEKIDFIWYVKRVSLWALVGYISGAGVYVIQEKIFPQASAAPMEEQIEHQEQVPHTEHAALPKFDTLNI